MKKFLPSVVFAILLGFAIFAQTSPMTIGKITRLGRVDAGTLPPLGEASAGGLVYDSISQAVLYSDGGSWFPMGGSSGGGGFALAASGQAGVISDGGTQTLSPSFTFERDLFVHRMVQTSGIDAGVVQSMFAQIGSIDAGAIVAWTGIESKGALKLQSSLFCGTDGTGSIGEVLTSQGAGVPPTWEPSSGGGNVLAASGQAGVISDGGTQTLSPSFTFERDLFVHRMVQTSGIDAGVIRAMFAQEGSIDAGSIVTWGGLENKSGPIVSPRLDLNGTAATVVMGMTGTSYICLNGTGTGCAGVAYVYSPATSTAVLQGGTSGVQISSSGLVSLDAKPLGTQALPWADIKSSGMMQSASIDAGSIVAWTGIESKGPVKLTGSIPQLTGSSGSNSFQLQSNIANAIASTSVGAYSLTTLNSLDSNDLFFEMHVPATANLFQIDKEGDALLSGSLTVPFSQVGSVDAGSIVAWSGIESKGRIRSVSVDTDFSQIGSIDAGTIVAPFIIMQGISAWPQGARLTLEDNASPLTANNGPVTFGNEVFMPNSAPLHISGIINNTYAGNGGTVTVNDADGMRILDGSGGGGFLTAGVVDAGTISASTVLYIQGYINNKGGEVFVQDDDGFHVMNTAGTDEDTVTALSYSLATGGTTFSTLSWSSPYASFDSSLSAPYLKSGTPHTLASVFVGAVTVASTNYGGDVLPAHAFTVNQVTFRTSAAGVGGSTNFAFRVSDGTNHCDCTFACNTAAGNINTTCAGAGGTGCALPASASLTYSVNSIGDCGTGPTIVGNVQVRGIWQ